MGYDNYYHRGTQGAEDTGEGACDLDMRIPKAALRKWGLNYVVKDEEGTDRQGRDGEEFQEKGSAHGGM